MKSIAHVAMIALAGVLMFVQESMAQKTGRDRVLKIDAVMLIDQDREVEGQVDFLHEHGRYTYLFSSAETLKSFQANPAKYEIQLGGACARMGALSGEGSPKLFAVHDKKLFIFASEQCRRSFLLGPEKFLLTDDPAPATTAESLARGQALLQRAIKGMGGPANLKSITTYREQLSRQTESGGKTYTVTDALTLKLPDAARDDTCWNEQCWATVVVGEAGWSEDSRGTEALINAQRVAFWRGPARHPLVLLSQRNSPDFLVTADGATRTISLPADGEITVDLLTVHCEQATTTLGIDAGGRIAYMAYQDRGPSLAIGRIEKTYSSFREFGDGVMLATHVDVMFEGKPVPDRSGDFVVQRINEAGDADLFKIPAPAPQTSARIDAGHASGK